MTPDQLARTHATANTTDKAWSRLEFANLLDSPFVFVVGNADSFCLARVIADEAEILTIATHPDHQMQGLAHRAMAAFEAEARHRSAVSAYLEVAADNQAAIGLYQSCGYQKTGLRKAYYTRIDGQKIDATLMFKSLTKG